MFGQREMQWTSRDVSIKKTGRGERENEICQVKREKNENTREGARVKPPQMGRAT